MSAGKPGHRSHDPRLDLPGLQQQPKAFRDEQPEIGLGWVREQGADGQDSGHQCAIWAGVGIDALGATSQTGRLVDYVDLQ